MIQSYEMQKCQPNTNLTIFPPASVYRDFVVINSSNFMCPVGQDHIKSLTWYLYPAKSCERAMSVQILLEQFLFAANRTRICTCTLRERRGRVRKRKHKLATLTTSFTWTEDITRYRLPQSPPTAAAAAIEALTTRGATHVTGCMASRLRQGCQAQEILFLFETYNMRINSWNDIASLPIKRNYQ